MARESERRVAVATRLIEQLSQPTNAPRSVVLRGPAGIGKSHLARDIATGLEEAGVPVRRVAGGEAQRSLAFGALLHLLPPSDTPVVVEFELVQRLRSSLVARGHTAVVVVDDIALLDDRSAGLIESVILQGDVVLLATERAPLAGSPADHQLSSVLRAHADVIDVPSMTDAELVDLLRDWAGPGEVGSVRRLSAMSRGNPLVLRELLTSARSTGALQERGGLWYLDGFRASGDSLERLVVEHLNRLGDQEWELLRCLAVAGTLPRQLAARIDVESLEHLERDGLLRDDPTVVGHPLYAEVIVDSMSQEQVRRVCSKLVATIGPDDDVDAARLGSWLLRAEHGIDDAVARRGVGLALARWENDLARRLIEAIEQPTVDDRVQLIWAHANAGDIELASIAADAAVGDSVTDHELVHSGLARAELWALQMNRSADAYAALAELRSVLSDPTHVAQVDAATALYSQMTGNSELAVRAGASASAARDAFAEDDEAQLAVLIADAFGKVFSGSFEAAGPVIEVGLALAEHRTERHHWVRLKVAEALRSMMLGDLARSNEVIGESLHLADVAGVRPAHVVWLGLASQIAQLEGDYGRAERRDREAVRAGDHVDDFGSAGFVRGDLSALLIETGQSRDLDPASSPIGLARARVRLAEIAEVDDLAADLAEATADSGYGLWAPWIAYDGARRTAAPRCAALLADWSTAFDGPVVRAFAELASGRVDGDADRLMDVGAAFESIGFVVAAIESYLAGLELTLERGAADHDAVVPALRRRLLGVFGLAGRVTPEVPPALARRLRELAELLDMPSDRQLEIAHLAANGMASKEIAAELVVSARTVDNHLAAVYRKLGVNSREELARVLS